MPHNISKENVSRKWQALWLLIVLLNPLFYGTHVVKGYIYDDDGKPVYGALLNHHLAHVEQTFCALSLLCAILLLLKPVSRVFRRCSVGLMACALLTSVISHVQLSGGLVRGLESFASSGRAVRFLTTGRPPTDGLFDATMRSTGLKLVADFIPKLSAVVQDWPITAMAIGILAALAIVAWISVIVSPSPKQRDQSKE